MFWRSFFIKHQIHDSRNEAGPSISASCLILCSTVKTLKLLHCHRKKEHIVSISKYARFFSLWRSVSLIQRQANTKGGVTPQVSMPSAWTTVAALSGLLIMVLNSSYSYELSTSLQLELCRFWCRMSREKKAIRNVKEHQSTIFQLSIPSCTVIVSTLQQYLCLALRQKSHKKLTQLMKRHSMRNSKSKTWYYVASFVARIRVTKKRSTSKSLLLHLPISPSWSVKPVWIH